MTVILLLAILAIIFGWPVGAVCIAGIICIVLFPPDENNHNLPPL